VLVDLVIDTNVFMHSCDPRQKPALRDSAKLLLDLLEKCNTNLCVDEGFDPDEARNRSYIAHEYYEHIGFAHPAFAVIVLLGRAGRIVQVSRSVPRNENRIIRRLVHDRTDRVFIQVALNSQSRTLVSHDFGHIPLARRGQIEERLGVSVTDALDGCERDGHPAA
jgi:hypothetical protein